MGLKGIVSVAALLGRSLALDKQGALAVMEVRNFDYLSSLYTLLLLFLYDLYYKYCHKIR